MGEEQRQHRRINKRVSIHFCLADEIPPKWDITFIHNISVGGIKFIAPSDLMLKDKILRLKIDIPELAPLSLELQAKVLEFTPRLHSKITSVVRAQFIDLSDSDKENLHIIEKLIDIQEEKIK